MKISRMPGEEFMIFLNGKQLSQESHFNYLGSPITQDRSCEKEIWSRIIREKNAFTKRKELLTKACSLCLKKKIIKTVIWSTLLYGAESWTLKKEDARRLESCEIWLSRKVLNITWSDKVCNEEVLRRVGEERAIISVINRRQKVCLGHTLRHGDLVPLVIENNSKETTWRTLSGNAGYSKEWQTLHSSLEECLRLRRTCLWAEHTHTHTHTHTGYTVFLGYTWVKRMHRGIHGIQYY